MPPRAHRCCPTHPASSRAAPELPRLPRPAARSRRGACRPRRPQGRDRLSVPIEPLLVASRQRSDQSIGPTQRGQIATAEEQARVAGSSQFVARPGVPPPADAVWPPPPWVRRYVRPRRQGGSWYPPRLLLGGGFLQAVCARARRARPLPLAGPRHVRSRVERVVRPVRDWPAVRWSQVVGSPSVAWPMHGTDRPDRVRRAAPGALSRTVGFEGGDVNTR